MLKVKRFYYLATILLIAVYFAAEYFDLLALAFPLLIGVSVWLLAKLIPSEQIADNWKKIPLVLSELTKYSAWSIILNNKPHKLQPARLESSTTRFRRVADREIIVQTLPPAPIAWVVLFFDKANFHLDFKGLKSYDTPFFKACMARHGMGWTYL